MITVIVHTPHYNVVRAVADWPYNSTEFKTHVPLSMWAINTFISAYSDAASSVSLTGGPLSHTEVYRLIQFVTEQGLPRERLDHHFMMFTHLDGWHKLRDAEFIYTLSCVNEVYGDLHAYISRVKNPWKCLQVFRLPGHEIGVEGQILTLNAFAQFPLSSLFDEFTDETRKKIAKIRAVRDKILSELMISPYDPRHTYLDFFKYTPTVETAWRCEGIVQAAGGDPTPPLAGTPTIVPREVAFERLSRDWCGLFEIAKTSGAVGVEFPWASVCIAGGSILRAVTNIPPACDITVSDVDIFVMGSSPAESAAAFEQLIHWFHAVGNSLHKCVYYAVIGSVVSIYIESIKRKFQVISQARSSPWGVISRFDLSHIGWCLYGPSADSLQFFCSPIAAITSRTRVSVVTRSVKRMRMDRFVKTLLLGYEIRKDPALLEKFDISPIVDNPTSEAATEVIISLCGYYFPEEGAPRLHALNMIMRDSKCDIIVSDPEAVIKRTVIRADFDLWYNAVNYRTFNVDTIRDDGRRGQFIQLRNGNRAIRLTTGSVTIEQMARGERDVSVAFRADADFANFARTLETIVFPMFRPGGRPAELIRGGLVTTVVSNAALAAQLSSGRSILSNQIGEPMNIEEDLKKGDSVQILFTVTIARDRIILAASKIIKHTRERIGAVDRPEEHPVAPAPEITIEYGE